MSLRRPFPRTLWLILAVALGVRLLGAWNGNLMYDESTHLACAETIDLRPQSFHLVARSVDHPPLSVYIVRLSGSLFGDSNFALRLLHVLFGTLTVVPVFFLGKKIFSEQAGLWAAALLAVDQFHQTWSYFIVPEVLLLFFVSLVLQQFLRLMESNARGDFVRLGVLLGLAYLAKETAIVLVPVLWLSIIIDPKLRPLIRNPMWYLAHGVALLVVSPDILWNFFHYYEGYFYRDVTFISGKIAPAPRSVLLFFGEILQHIIDPIEGYWAHHATQSPALLHWPAALLYTVAAVVAWQWRHQAGVRLLLVTFLTVFLFYTFLPAPRGRLSWWWPSITVLPAVIFAGHALERFVTNAPQALAAVVGGRMPGVLTALFLGYLGVHAVFTGLRTGTAVPRRPASAIVKDVLDDTRRASSSKELLGREWWLLHALHINGAHPDLYAYLARIAYERKQVNRAEYFVRRSLRLDSGNQLALATSRLMSVAKDDRGR
jgi:4-amino-4-deoxy-L-arabinose transferase-like glycosyltransferase